MILARIPKLRFPNSVVPPAETKRGGRPALACGYQAGQAVGRLLGGEPADLYDYLDAMDSVFQAYWILRHEHYALERRWPAEPFWIRRQQ